MRTPLVLTAALVLAGCGGYRATKPTTIPTPPPSLTTACAAPTPLPDRGITDQEVEVLWGRDRAALRACRSRHGGLASWVGTVLQ